MDKRHPEESGLATVQLASTKLPRDKTFAFGKTFAFTSERRPQVLKYFVFEILRGNIRGPRKFWPSNVLYYSYGMQPMLVQLAQLQLLNQIMYQYQYYQYIEYLSVPRGPQLGKILYEISNLQHFKQDFKIPGNISRFLEYL